MMQRFLSGAVLLLAAILTGCASSLPPAQPATSLQSIVGNWEGSITDSQGNSYNATLVIREDGTYESTIPSFEGSPFRGTIVIQDGKFRWTESKSGTTGDFVLHEGDGKQVLIWSGEGQMQRGNTSGEVGEASDEATL